MDAEKLCAFCRLTGFETGKSLLFARASRFFVVSQGENPNKKSLRVKQKYLTSKCESRKKANQDPQNQRFSSVKKASNQLNKNQRKTGEKGCKTRKNRGHNIAL